MSENYPLSGSIQRTVYVQVIQQTDDSSEAAQAIERFCSHYHVHGNKPAIHRKKTVRQIRDIMWKLTTQERFEGVSGIVTIILSCMRNINRDVMIDAKDGVYSFNLDIVEILAKTRVRGIPLIFLLETAEDKTGGDQTDVTNDNYERALDKVAKQFTIDAGTNHHDIFTYQFWKTGFPIASDEIIDFTPDGSMNLQDEQKDTDANELLLILSFLHNTKDKCISTVDTVVQAYVKTHKINLKGLPTPLTSLAKSFCFNHLRKNPF